MSRASVQATRIGLEALEGNVVRLADEARRAILQVEGLNFALLGDAEREAVAAGFAAFLNGLSFPVQVLVRIQPVYFDRYVAELERRALGLPERLAEIARDHAAFVRRLSRNRTLLERSYYVVVPAQDAAFHRRRWSPRRRRDPSVDALAAGRQLSHRCQELAGQLASCGLIARRLSGPEIAQLFHSCWCPELARVQRLRRALDEYTALVVTGLAPNGGDAPCSA